MASRIQEGGGGMGSGMSKTQRKVYKDEGLMFAREAKKLMKAGKTDSMTNANTSKSRSATKPTVPVKNRANRTRSGNKAK